MKPRKGYVRKFARTILDRNGITSPPVDLKVLVAKEGLEYEEVDYFPDDVDALIINDEGVITAAVNKNHHPNRRRFSLAHELGHYFFHGDRSVLEDVATIDTPVSRDEVHGKDVYESEADTFAGELLVPLAFLKTAYKPGMTTADLASIFEVSEEVAAIALSTHFNSLF
ncbi:MAG: ImmA/IrrE family metallo-endopeptidase [Pyrinomonadaceae bacterium]